MDILSIKNSAEKKKELARIKEEMRRTSHKFVEHMALEEAVSESKLRQMCQILSQKQYDDVTEERSIAGVCGYPLCKRKVDKTGKCLFKISRESNHVFDMTTRGRFCSNKCFFSSSFLHEQLREEEAWTNLSKTLINIVFLPEVDSQKCQSHISKTALSLNSYFSAEEIKESLKVRDLANKNDSIKSSKMSDSTDSNSAEESKECKLLVDDKVTDSSVVQPSNASAEPIETRQESVLVSRPEMSNKNEKEPRKMFSFEKVTKYIKEWVNEMSYNFYKKCIISSIKNEDAAEDEKELVLPLDDRKDIMEHRRNLVKERIHQVMSSLAPQLNFDIGVVSRCFKEFIPLLSFSRGNILLSHLEWEIVCMILLRLFSLKYDVLKQCVDAQNYKKQLNLYGISVKQIDQIVNLLSSDYKNFEMEQKFLF